MKKRKLAITLCACVLTLTACGRKNETACSAPDVLEVLRGLVMGGHTASSGSESPIVFSVFHGDARDDGKLVCHAHYALAPAVTNATRGLKGKLARDGLPNQRLVTDTITGDVEYVVSEERTDEANVTKKVTLTNFDLAKSKALNDLVELYRSAKTMSRIVAPTALSWDAQSDGATKLYSGGGLNITLTSRTVAGADGPTPVIEVGDGEEVLTQEGDPGFSDPSARILIGHLDPRVPGNQVIFMTFSGGAHCCTRIDVLEPRGKATKILSLGRWDGEPLQSFPKDIDQDGIPDLVLADNRFLYTFGSYAGSYPPSLVYNIVDGKLIDHSSSPGLRSLYTSEMIEFGGWCLLHQNGACAGFVAAASRAGRAGYAWELMLASYDHNDASSLPTTCRTPALAASCPANQTVPATDYPSGLMTFLSQAGYPIGDPPTDSVSGPSFECGRVTSEVLKLVCATPEMQKLDMILASAYSVTKSVSKDQPSLLKSQLEWIRARNNGPADVQAISGSYQQRITELIAYAQQQQNASSAPQTTSQ